MVTMARRLRINADAFARLVGAIAERPRSYPQIAEITGLHDTTIREYVKALHHHKQVHVAARAPDRAGRLIVPMFLLGFGIDVPPAKHAPMTAAERKRKQRSREYAAAGKPPPKIRLSKRAVNSVFALGEKVK